MERIGKVNLLPWRELYTKFRTRRFYLFLMAANILILVISYPVLLKINKYSVENKSRINKLTKVKERIIYALNSNKSNYRASVNNEFHEKLEFLQANSAYRFQTSKLLRKIVTCMSNNIYLTKIIRDKESLCIEAVSYSNMASCEFVKNLEIGLKMYKLQKISIESSTAKRSNKDEVRSNNIKFKFLKIQ